MGIEIIKIPIQTSTVKPYIKQGDTIPKWEIEFGVDDGVDLIGTTIKMQIYWNKNKVIDVSNGKGITINSALKLTVDERSKSSSILPVGTSKGDLEITDVAGRRVTYFDVHYTIIKHYTT